MTNKQTDTGAKSVCFCDMWVVNLTLKLLVHPLTGYILLQYVLLSALLYPFCMALKHLNVVIPIMKEDIMPLVIIILKCSISTKCLLATRANAFKSVVHFDEVCNKARTHRCFNQVISKNYR